MKKTQTNTELSSYELAANEFALKHGIKLTFGSPSYGSHFDDDKQSRVNAGYRELRNEIIRKNKK